MIVAASGTCRLCALGLRSPVGSSVLVSRNILRLPARARSGPDSLGSQRFFSDAVLIDAAKAKLGIGKENVSSDVCPTGLSLITADSCSLQYLSQLGDG